MAHFLHMVLFAAILSTFFAFLSARREKRLRFGLILFGLLAGGGFVLGLLMFPFA